MLAPDCVVAIAGSGSAGAARFAQTRSPSVRTRHGSTRTLGIRGQTPTPTRSPRSSGGAMPRDQRFARRSDAHAVAAVDMGGPQHHVDTDHHGATMTQPLDIP